MFDLDEYLPFLVRRIVPRIDEGFESQLTSVDLVLEEWRVLVTLFDRGPQSLGSLSQHVSINLSTLSRLVSRMHHRKLVRRLRPSRSIEIELLPSGRHKVDVLLPRARAYEARVVSHLTKDELAEAKRLLRKMHDAFAAEVNWFAAGNAAPADLADHADQRDLAKA